MILGFYPLGFYGIGQNVAVTVSEFELKQDKFLASSKFRDFEIEEAARAFEISEGCRKLEVFEEYRIFEIDEEGNHMKNFDKKDYQEIVWLSFEFKASTKTPINPSVAIELKSGEVDAAMGSMLLGYPVIQGSKVMQRVQAGLIGNKYLIRCTADSPEGSTFVIGGELPVVKF